MALRIGEPHIPSRCGADFPNGCVEVTQTGMDSFVVRSTTLWATGSVTLDREEWTTFVAAVKAGEYDPAPA